MNIIEITNLRHQFADKSIGIDDISLTVKEGEFVVIAGRNGSGKTTFLRHLNGLLLSDTGVVKIGGISVSDNIQMARQMVGMVFQDPDTQIVGETVFDDVAFGPENLCLDKHEVKRRVIKALKAVDLINMADQRPHVLSGGEKRRLAVAGVLAMEPRVIVFDEPFSDLDYPGVRQVLHQILSLHKAGHTILMSTHDLEKVIVHADRLLIMSKGKIVMDDEPEKIIKNVEAFGVRQPCASRLGMKIESWLN